MTELHVVSKADLGYEDCEDDRDRDPLELMHDESLRVKDLGYSQSSFLFRGSCCDDSVPSAIDLGYGHEPPRVSSRRPRDASASAVRAVQIRNGNRRPAPAPAPAPNNSSRNPGQYLYRHHQDDSDSDSECDDSSVDYSDCSSDGEFFSEIQEESMTEITCDYYTEQEQENMDNACRKYGVSAVTMEFHNDAPVPRRVSLQFTQQAESANGTIRRRSGHLDVSIATSRLPRRGTFDGSELHHHAHTTHGTTPTPTPTPTVNRNNSGLSISTTPMRRISMDMKLTHTSHGETSTTSSSTTHPNTNQPNTRRRITMDLAACRRGSLEYNNSSHNPNNTNTTCTNPNRRNSRVTLNDRDPKSALTHTSKYVSLSQSATRRLSMDYSKPTKDHKEERRISMNLSKSPFPRNKPLPKDNSLYPVERKPSMDTTASSSNQCSTCHDNDDHDNLNNIAVNDNNNNDNDNQSSLSSSDNSGPSLDSTSKENCPTLQIARSA